MRMLPFVALAVTMAASCAAATPGGIDGLRWKNRVILLSAPDAADPHLIEQRRMLGAWGQAAGDRDVVVVEVVGLKVVGVGDPADRLRSRFALSPDRFGLLLIGKDGHVAFRSDHPVAGAGLGETIDAMPMRRAGQR